MTTTIDKMTCTWCDADGTQKKCYRCKDACRHPQLADQAWTFKVTGNNGLLPYVFCAPVPPWNESCFPYFTRVNACCSSIAAGPRPAPNDRSDTSGLYRWRRYQRTYSSVVYQWAICTTGDPGLGCKIIGPTATCQSTFQQAYGCALGWRRIAGITLAKLYISRTKPRYGCDEEDRCKYRVALVIDGEIGVTWGTQYTQGSQNTINSSSQLCDFPLINCNNYTSGIWPVGSPPPFDPSLLSVTMHPFRSVLRRSVDTLEFPMVFNQENAVSLSCGPQCAASISAITPTFADPPNFTCNAPDDLPSDSGNLDSAENSLCTPTSCDDTFCDPPNFINHFSGFENTLTGSSDSGVVTPGSLPDTAFPTEYTVELY